jgi:L-ribulose-5-phosphate 3-epimerase UlaE
MVDAVGGVAKIVGVALKIKEAANTVHQNKKDCHHIKSRVDILNKTFSHHENNTELAEDSAVMAALEALDGILTEALEVITKCQKERCIICVYYTAGNLSRRLSKVEQRISYLSSDAMLTIMSCQLLRKSQEGASHPSPQVWLKIII